MSMRVSDNLIIQDVAGPKISLDAKEVAKRIGPELNPEAERYSVVGRGSRTHDSPEKAIEAVENGGLYIQEVADGTNRIDVTEGVEVVEYDGPVSNVNQLVDLVEEKSSMAFTGYHHGGATLSKGDSLGDALQELDGRNIALVGDIENAKGDLSAQAGYTSGTTFGYREDMGELTTDEQATLDAAAERVLGIDDVTEEGGF